MQRTRVLLAVVSVLSLLGLCIHYGATDDDRWPYPTAEQLDAEYERYVGEDVLLFGDVRSVRGDGMELEVPVSGGDSDHIVVTTDRVPDGLEEGGFVQVYGVIQPDNHVDAMEVAVVDRTPAHRLYKLAVSVIGLGVAAGYFLWHWRWSLRPFGWEVRGRG